MSNNHTWAGVVAAYVAGRFEGQRGDAPTSALLSMPLLGLLTAGSGFGAGAGLLSAYAYAYGSRSAARAPHVSGCACAGCVSVRRGTGSEEDVGSEVGAPIIDVAKAVKNNKLYARDLGWKAKVPDIARLIGLSGTFSDESFALATARFQTRQGLRADGMIGPTTLSVIAPILLGQIPARPCQRIQTVTVLDDFDHNKTALKPAHHVKLIDIARCILSRRTGTDRVTEVFTLGHTDDTGTDAYNLDLGNRRAREVAKQLAATLERMLPGSSRGIQLTPASVGESTPVGSPAQNRRVEVLLPPSNGHCGRFFAEYDLETLPGRGVPFGIEGNPNLNQDQKDRRMADVNAMVRVLLDRRRRRASDALSGTATVFPAVTDSETLRRARDLSAVQLRLFRRFFPGPTATGPIDLPGFQSCFERFANGDLRLGVDGRLEPNSTFYFLFAEFALFCIENGISADVWRRVLEPFVKTQEIFIYVYRPPPHPAPPSVGAPPPRGPNALSLESPTDYRSENFDGGGQSDAARKASLRRRYAPFDLTRLRQAYGENLVRAQRR
jgi:outer membrane protein OmpA-like peptidoglycan-associated protein